MIFGKPRKRLFAIRESAALWYNQKYNLTIMINLNFQNIFRKQFLLPAAIAVIIAVFFMASYLNENKQPANNANLPSGQESQPQSSTSTDSQTAAGVDSINTAPLPEITIGQGKANTNTLPVTVPQNTKPATTMPSANSGAAATRDQQRQSDMRRLAAAQANWRGYYKRYYTCSATGGDCRGKVNGLPSSIGSGGNGAVDPLNSGRVCGRDYAYCGIDNTGDSSKFCYYAKLETGGYYAVSGQGDFERSTLPLNLADCATAPVIKPQAEKPQKTTPQERDVQRQSDMVQLSAAQSKWFGLKGQYYTCSADGGDCQGKKVNYPASLGVAMAKTPIDPLNTGTACGRDEIYCGLNNVGAAVNFCYYAKLETGGYYTASNLGNAKRSAPPVTFGDCGQPN